MQIFLASDHRGYSLKSKLAVDLAHIPVAPGDTIKIIDLGPKEYNPDDDYNDAAIAVARAILEAQKDGDKQSFGVLICGSAIGISIQANRFKGIRAAGVTDLETATTAREHSDANVICLSADALARAEDPLESEKAYEDIIAIIERFLSTPFSNEPRYIRRIKRLDEEAK